MKFIFIFCIFITVLKHPTVHAKLFEFNIINYGTNDPGLLAVLDGFTADLEQKSQSENIDLSKIERYLQGIGQANTMSMKGSGSFYNHNINNFAVGINTSVSTDMGDQSFSSVYNGNIDAEKINGIAINPSLSLAFNSNSKKSIRFYMINLGYYVNSKMSSGIASKHINFGFHIQNKIINKIPTPLGIMVWNGVDLTYGIEHVFLDISLTKNFSKSIEKTTSIPSIPGGNNIKVVGTVSGPYTVGIKSSSTSIPLEISTGYKLAQFFNQYIGLGIDLTFAKTQTYANASPNINFTTDNSLIILPTVNTQVNFLANRTKKNNIFDLRMFTGFGLEQGPLGFFFHFNKSLLINVFSLSIGIKFLF